MNEAVGKEFGRKRRRQGWERSQLSQCEEHRGGCKGEKRKIGACEWKGVGKSKTEAVAERAVTEGGL